MERVHIAVPETTAKKVAEIKEKLRKETGVSYSNGDVVAEAVSELHKKEIENKGA